MFSTIYSLKASCCVSRDDNEVSTIMLDAAARTLERTSVWNRSNCLQFSIERLTAHGFFLSIHQWSLYSLRSIACLSDDEDDDFKSYLHFLKQFLPAFEDTIILILHPRSFIAQTE